MCTFIDKPELKRPEAEEVTVYKVFGNWKFHKGKPFPFVAVDKFKFGWNEWNKKIGDHLGQSGFQVFTKLKDAKTYCTKMDLVCPVAIKTKDIVKMTDRWDHSDGDFSEVCEVKSFNLLKKDWKKAKSEAKKKE